MASRRTYVFAGIAVAGLCVAAGVICASIHRTVVNSYAVWWVADMIVEHMEANSGAWPGNWSELEDDYATCVERSGAAWTFQSLKDRVDVDWNADPQSLLQSSAGRDVAAFKVIRLRDGSDAHWESREPNQIVLEYLRSVPADSERDLPPQPEGVSHSSSEL